MLEQLPVALLACLVGAGIVVAGGRHDTIKGNLFAGNGAWAVATVPYTTGVANGPADDVRGHAPRGDLRERRAAVALVPGGVVRLVGADEVDAVMPHPGPLRGGRLRRPDVHAAVELPRIG